MAIIQGWMPPTREHYDLIVFMWQFYPVFASLQWATTWYGMGKTSVRSVFNIPGRLGWMCMESPGFLTLIYIMSTLTKQEGITDLPWQNKVLAGLFVIHYSYRAIIYPLIAPSMSPIHAGVCLLALVFQLINATSIGSYLAAYGPQTKADWDAQLAPWPTLQFVAGISIFYLGLAANYVHDDELREIRRREEDRLKRVALKEGRPVSAVDKHYQLPEAALFRYMLYPHYFVEWVEWTGFYMAAGWSCVPARLFVVNEVAAMLPRAVRGKQWYIDQFGAEKVGRRWAVLPGIL